MEQWNIYNQINLTRGLGQGTSRRPSAGAVSLFPSVGQNSVYSRDQRLPLPVLARSRRRSTTTTPCWSSYGNGSGNPDPNPPNQDWGRTDYDAVPGMHDSPLIANNFPQAYINRSATAPNPA